MKAIREYVYLREVEVFGDVYVDAKMSVYVAPALFNDRNVKNEVISKINKFSYKCKGKSIQDHLKHLLTEIAYIKDALIRFEQTDLEIGSRVNVNNLGGRRDHIIRVWSKVGGVYLTWSESVNQDVKGGTLRISCE